MRLRLLSVLLCLGHIGWAHAEIYKYVDKNGHVTYSSTPLKGAKKLNLEPLPIMTPPGKVGEDLRVNQATQKRRDDARRRILEDELAAEQKLLAEARQKLQDAENTPHVYRTQDGKILRNVAAYEEDVKNAQNEVTLHEKNVEALKTELSRLK